MNKLSVLSIVVILALLVGCTPVQQGTSKEDASVPIDQVVVQDGNLVDNSGEPVISDEPASEDVSEDAAAEDAEASEDEVSVVCNDGIDNDRDGLTDELDPGCAGKNLEQIEAEQAVEDAQAPARENVVIIEETQIVRLRPVAADPDSDQLTFTYTTPLNGQGEWQTTYGDAGQYTITITASDGELTASRDALIIVNKKEEAPSIELANPQSIQQSLDENTELAFSVTAKDLNNDQLVYSWKLDGEEVSQSNSYTYSTDYFSAGSHTLKVEVTDGTTTTSMIWAVDVANVDRAPVLAPIPDITVRETEAVTLTPQATDPDGDALEFSVSEPVGDDGTWQTTYDSAGVYTLNVGVSDGEMEDGQEVKVTVINVNRPPVIEDIIQVQ